jgi:hypothetical protein
LDLEWSVKKASSDEDRKEILTKALEIRVKHFETEDAAVVILELVQLSADKLLTV